MVKTTSKYDPRGVIADAYRMKAILPEECRSIFLDWALEPRSQSEMRLAAQHLLDSYAGFPAHPMTAILQAALTEITDAPVRRGGRKARGLN